MLLPEELENVDMLKELEPRYLRALAQLGQLREYGPGQTLFQQGEYSPWIFLLLTGQVGLEISPTQGKTVPFQVLQPGHMVGYSAVLGDGIMADTARAQTPCRAAALNREALEKAFLQDPAFGVEFLRRLGGTVADRLTALSRQLATPGQG